MGERRINALKEDIDFLQDELAEASEAKDLADCAVEEAAAELGRLTSDVGTLTERLASANDECAALRSDLKKRDAEAHAVAAKLGKAQGKEEAIKLSAAIDAADARVATAEAEAETSKKEGAAAREKLAASDSENRALTTKLDAAAAAAAESLAAVQGGHDDRVAELEATVAQMAAAETELRNEIADVRDSITSRRANGRGGSGGASSGARRSAAPRTKGKAAAKPVPAGGSGAEKRKSVRPPAHWAGEEGDSDDEAFVRGPGLKKGTSLVMIDSLEAMIGDLTDTADRMAKVGDDSDDEELLVGDEFMKQFLEDAANEVKEEKLKAAKSEKVPSSSSKAKKGKKGSALSTQQIARIEKAKQAIEKQTSDQSDSVADTIAQMRGALGKLRKMPSFVSEEKMRVVAEGKGHDPLKAVPTAEEKKAGKKGAYFALRVSGRYARARALLHACLTRTPLFTSSVTHTAELKKVVAKKKAKKKADKERKKSGGLSSSSAAPKSGGVKRERPKSSSSNASTDSQKSKRSETKRTKTPPKQRKPAAAAAGSSKAKPAGAAAGVRGKTPPARPRASPSKKAPTTKAAVRSKSPPRPRKM